MHTFSIKEIIGTSWRLFTNHWGVLLGTLLIVMLLNGAFSFATEVVGDDSPGGVVITLCSIAVSIVVQLGMYRMWLDLTRGKEVRVEQLFSEYLLSPRYLGASIAYFIMIFVGFLLFIIPGIYLSIKYGYYGYAMVDRRLSITDSFKLSAQITEGYKWQLLLLGLAYAGLVIVSIIPLGLGLLATIPMAMIGGAITYITLLSLSEQPTMMTPPSPDTPLNDTPAPFVPLS